MGKSCIVLVMKLAVIKSSLNLFLQVKIFVNLSCISNTSDTGSGSGGGGGGGGRIRVSNHELNFCTFPNHITFWIHCWSQCIIHESRLYFDLFS